MRTHFFSFFKRDITYETIHEFMESDELRNDKISGKEKKKKGNVRFSINSKNRVFPREKENVNESPMTKRRSNSDSDQERGGNIARVKVVMTKKEAERLLRKCRDGGVLGFKDVAQEIINIPTSQVCVISSSEIGVGAALPTVPEEP